MSDTVGGTPCMPTKNSQTVFLVPESVDLLLRISQLKDATYLVAN